VNGRGGARSPLYVRVLHLKHIRPGGLMCFLLFEGVVALAILLSLAELVNWWSVIVLPAIVAALVKINDVVAGAFKSVQASDATMRFTTRRMLGEARGMASVPRRRRDSGPVVELESPTQVLDPLPGGEQPVVVAEPSTRAARRRAMNQRPFAPVAGAEAKQNDW
jgi:hypothetical protein